MMDLTDTDFALFLYEDLRLELLSLCREKVVYIQVVRDRLEDLAKLSNMIDTEVDPEILDALYEKYN